MNRQRYSDMQSRARAMLIIGCIILSMVLPACAYDYQGAPTEGANNPDNLSESGMSEIDMSGLMDILETTDFASLISLFISLILGLLGITAAS